MHIGWLRDGGAWYYLVNGAPRTGWVPFADEHYYFWPDGTMATNSWVEGVYYVGPDGARLEATRTPDGYYVDSTGRWNGGASAAEAAPEQAQSETPVPAPATDAEPADADALPYVLNTATKVFHYNTCVEVGKMALKNKDEVVDTYENLAKKGYKPCSICNPQPSEQED